MLIEKVVINASKLITLYKSQLADLLPQLLRLPCVTTGDKTELLLEQSCS
jgi:hypothetical protein